MSHLRRTVRTRCRRPVGGVRSIACGVALASLALGSAALAEEFRKVQVTGHVVVPEPMEPTDAAVREKLKVPAGFKIEKYAEGLMNSRVMAVNPRDGSLYVGRREQQDVVLVRDADGDGKAELIQPVAQRPKLHGVAVHGDWLFMVAVNDVYRAKIQPDGTLRDIERIIDDLPDGGQHHNRTLAVGPDEKLYVSVGSTCNTCEETSVESATIVRSTLDGKSRTIYASGLRNTIGFGWHPATNQLWGADHGIDWLGDDAQREEFNKIEQGKRYGWPFIYEDGKVQPERFPGDGTSAETLKKLSTSPTLMYTAHSAPMQMAFYTGAMFPAEFKNDAFVAMRGSWNRNPPSGYEVVRVRFNERGEPTEMKPFITGWIQPAEGDKWSSLGRLCGLVVAKDGALLVSDDKNGVIYRVSYAGATAAAQ